MGLVMLKDPWLNYLIEALGLGLFMVSAGLFATLLYAPQSPALSLIPSEGGRGLLMGAAMGLTAIALIYSPPGKRSGAHINPAVTVTFYRLHKITITTAVAYIMSQFIGATLGVLFVAKLLGNPFTTAPIQYVVTVPGGGAIAAFGIEFLMSFTLMLMILITSNHQVWSQFTGVFSGILLTFYIPFASSISGMSINPARTVGSALPAQLWSDIWIYLIAPPSAMLLAAELYLRYSKRPTRELCCKLCPTHDVPCVSHRCCGLPPSINSSPYP